MAIQVSWVNDRHTALHVELVGDWTWDDLRGAISTVSELLETVPHSVHTLYDFRHSAAIPPHALTHARNLMKPRIHPNAGTVLIVGGGVPLRALYDVFSGLIAFRLANRRVVLVDTLEEALSLVSADVG